MRFREQSSLFSFISLLAFIFLLSAGPAFANPPGSMHGKSKGMSSSSGDYGKSRHEGFGDPNKSSHRDGMHKRRGGGRHSMHASGSGMGHKKGHGDHGSGSMLAGAHQDAKQFIKHILKNKDGMSLTDEQVQQLSDLKINFKKNMIMMKAEAKIAEVDLHELMRKEAKLSAIEAQMNTVHGLRTKQHIASIKAKRDARALLSEEQQARMSKIHERIKSHGGSKGHTGDSSKAKKCKKSKGKTTDGHKK